MSAVDLEKLLECALQEKAFWEDEAEKLGRRFGVTVCPRLLCELLEGGDKDLMARMLVDAEARCEL